MQSLIARRLWESPVAIIVFMAVVAISAVGYEISIGVVSFALMAQALHTIGDIGIFAVFERGLSSGEERSEGIWGIILGFMSFALILGILPFTDQGVGTSMLLPVLSSIMMVLKVQYLLVARRRDRSHSATVGAGAHVLGDLAINVSAITAIVMIGVLREFGYGENVVNLVDLIATFVGIGVAVISGVIGIFIILRKNHDT